MRCLTVGMSMLPSRTPHTKILPLQAIKLPGGSATELQSFLLRAGKRPAKQEEMNNSFHNLIHENCLLSAAVHAGLYPFAAPPRLAPPYLLPRSPENA